MEELIYLLNGIAPLSPALLAHLKSILRLHKFKKGTIILREGEMCNFIFYIGKGLFRSYCMRHKKEVSNWFMKEGDICISIRSFHRRIPSQENIMALENAAVWGMTHAQLEETYRLFPEFNLHGRLISHEYQCRWEDRITSLVQQTPQAKYEELMEKDPDLVHRILNKHMASYLDVGERTFTQMRIDYAAKLKR